MSYKNEKLVSDVGPSSGEPTEHSSPWHAIKTSSVLAFVERVSAFMGAPNDRTLRRKPTAMALSNGAAWFEHAGFKYTGPHVLRIYAQHGRPEDPIHEPFRTRAEWDGFCQAMQALRDPNTPMLARGDLRKVGESIEARQRPLAEAKGWT